MFDPQGGFGEFEDEGGVDDRINRLALLRDVNQVADPDDDHWILTDDSQAGMRFDSTGRLLQIFDAGGSGVNLEYDNGRLTSITDSADRSLDLTYNASGQLSAIEAPPFEYDSAGGTVQQTTLRRVTLSYYDDGGLKQIWSPRRDGDYPWSSDGEEAGEPIYAIELAYYDSGLLKAIADYEGNRSRFFYYPTTGALARVDHPAVYDYVLDEEVVTSRAYAYTFDGATGDPITEVTNERNGLTTYGFDDQGRLERVTDPLGRVVTQLTWTPQNRVATSTNVLGGVTTMTYNDDGNPIQIENESGTVTMDYIDLHRLWKITDAVGQVVEYKYQDEADNPMRITQIDGPGEADDAYFRYNCADSPAAGKVKQLASPNRVIQGFQYEGRNVSRYLRQNDRSNLWHGDYSCSESTGGISLLSSPVGDDGCGQIDSSSINSPTGEPTVVGGEENCAGEVSLSPVPEIEGLGGVAHGDDTCESDAPLDEDCGVCGCERRRNEAGSVVQMQEGGGDCPARGAPSEDPEILSEGYDCQTTTSGQSKMAYNANEQLTCIHRKYPGSGARLLEHTIAYDALSRMTEYDVFNHIDSYADPEVDWGVYPNHHVSYRYSDTTGASYVRYFRSPEVESPDPYYRRSAYRAREFKTEYRTDLAGRIVSVTRDDQTTKYYYEDSTVYPAVTEVRPDGSKTGIFLDKDGQVHRIAHTDPHGIVMAAYDYTRDPNGRVTRVEEEIKDRRAADGYRSDVIEYVYGDGALKASDLDDNAANVPNADKLYYDFLADLGDGHALKSSDPNRLVVERQTNTDSGDERVAVTFMKEYFYDPGGNRLAMRVSDPATGEVQSISRYNYFTREVYEAEATSDTPGTPRLSATLAMDYEGRGMDKLFSTLTYYPADPDRVDVVQFGYDYDFYEKEDSDITSRIDSTYVYNEGSGWFEAYRATTSYGYKNGSLAELRVDTRDNCPSSCETCDGSCGDVVTSFWIEEYLHDVFGRRVAKISCANEPTTSDSCKYRTAVTYDYNGMSNQVLAVRQKAQVVVDDYPDLYEDRFVSTYTHGPLGVITQTEEGRNADPADNRDHYVLEDLMGGHNVLAVDHDGDSATDRMVSYQTFDAFGNVQKKWLPHTATFAWRGSEGSKTDTAANLVEMGARTYDPTLGRFLQADALPMASITSQGMNRYTYCENDPVNASDPSGLKSVFRGTLGVSLGLIGVASGVAMMMNGMVVPGFVTLFASLALVFESAILLTDDCETQDLLHGLSLLSRFLAALALAAQLGAVWSTWGLEGGGLALFEEGLSALALANAKLANLIGGASSLLGWLSIVDASRT